MKALHITEAESDRYRELFVEYDEARAQAEDPDPDIAAKARHDMQVISSTLGELVHDWTTRPMRDEGDRLLAVCAVTAAVALPSLLNDLVCWIIR